MAKAPCKYYVGLFYENNNNDGPACYSVTGRSHRTDIPV